MWSRNLKLKAVCIINKDIAEKVLMVGPDYRDHKGGIGAVIALEKPEYEVFNFIPTYRPFDSNLTKSLFFVRQMFKISWFLMRNPAVKVVHMHTSQDGSFFRKLAVLFISKKILGRKVINHTNASHFHKFYEGGSKWVKKTIEYYLKNSDATFTVSESWRRYYVDTFKLDNVYKVFNLSERKPVQVKDVNVFDGNKVIDFVFLGRVGERKGIYDLLDAIIQHKKELEGKMTLAVGGDGEVEKLQEIIEKEGLGEMVKYVGWISGDAKDELLRKGDVFILPSYNEGMPLSILEAMGYGKPVISTPVAGIPELVYHERNGIMVQPGDKDAIYKSLLHYINNQQDVVKHGEESLKVIEDFYAEAVMPKVREIYQSLLN